MQGIKARRAVAVDDDGTEVVAVVTRINFGANLTVTDDGSGQITIAGSGSSGSGASYVPLANGDPDAPAYLFTPSGDGLYVEDTNP